MSKLILNTASLAIFKYDPDFFGTFDKIKINAAGALFTREVYTELSKKGLSLNAANVSIIDLKSEPLSVGDVTLDGKTDYSGKYLIGGKIKLTNQNALNGIEGIFAQMIIAPEGTRFDFKVDGVIRYYPVGAQIIEGEIELTPAYAERLSDGAILWTLHSVNALDNDAVRALAAKNVTIHSGQLLITEEAERDFGTHFRANSRTIVPAGCTYIAGGHMLTALNAEVYSEKLYINGMLNVSEDAIDAFEKFEQLVVSSTAYIPKALLPQWKKIGKARKVIVYEGEIWQIDGDETISHEMLEAASVDGIKYTLLIDGMASFTADVTKADLDCFAAVYYDGSVTVPAKLIPAFKRKVIEGDGVILPPALTGAAKGVMGLLDTFGLGGEDEDTQTINTASFIRA